MQDDHATEAAATEQPILSMLLDDDPPPVRSVEEIVREIGEAIAVRDALADLDGAGLIHRFDQFVFPTRAAREASRRLVDA